MSADNIVDFEQVQELLKAGTVLIDVRNPGEVSETGKIPGSVNIPLPELQDAFNLDSALFEDKYGFTLPEKEAQMILSCKYTVCCIQFKCFIK